MPENGQAKEGLPPCRTESLCGLGQRSAFRAACHRTEFLPPHIHDEIDHVWFVVTGQVQVRLGDEELDLRSGDVAWVPHGQLHSFSTGSEGATMLQVDTPRPLDAYFRDLAEVFPRGARPDPSTVIAIMARHDTRPSPG